jgi:hypothetical protein
MPFPLWWVRPCPGAGQRKSMILSMMLTGVGVVMTDSDNQIRIFLFLRVTMFTWDQNERQ